MYNVIRFSVYLIFGLFVLTVVIQIVIVACHVIAATALQHQIYVGMIAGEKRIRSFKISLMVLSLLAFCTGTGALVIHYLNGFLMSTNNTLTNCLSVSSTTYKYKNTPTFLLAMTSAIGTGILFSLILTVSIISWYCGKNLSLATASKQKTPLFLLSSLALVGMSVGGGYYFTFICEFRTYSCGSAVLQACLIQAILLGVGDLSLFFCLILCLLLPKLAITSISSKQNPCREAEPGNNSMLREMRVRPEGKQRKRLQNVEQYYKRFKGGLEHQQSHPKDSPLLLDSRTERKTHDILHDEQFPHNGQLSRRARPTIWESKQNFQQVQTLNETVISPTDQLTIGLLLNDLPQQITSRAYQPVLPFMSFHPYSDRAPYSVPTTKRIEVKPLETTHPKPKHIWHYPEIPFKQIQQDSLAQKYRSNRAEGLGGFQSEQKENNTPISEKQHLSYSSSIESSHQKSLEVSYKDDSI